MKVRNQRERKAGYLFVSTALAMLVGFVFVMFGFKWIGLTIVGILLTICIPSGIIWICEPYKVERIEHGSGNDSSGTTA